MDDLDRYIAEQMKDPLFAKNTNGHVWNSHLQNS